MATLRKIRDQLKPCQTMRRKGQMDCHDKSPPPCNRSGPLSPAYSIVKNPHYLLSAASRKDSLTYTLSIDLSFALSV